MSPLFISGGQSFDASSSASVLPMNIQSWFPLGLIGLLPCCPRDPEESSPAQQFESISSSALSLLYGPTFTSIHDYGENHSLTVWTLLAKWCLCFLTHSVGLSQLIFQGASHMVLSNYESGLFCHFSSPYWLSGAQTLVQTIYDGQCHLETWYLINISWVNGWMDGKLDEVLSSQDSWLFPGPPSPLL